MIFLWKIGPEVQQKSSEILHLDATKTGWWFQPIWKIWVKLGSSSPIFGVNIKNIWVATTKNNDFVRPSRGQGHIFYNKNCSMHWWIRRFSVDLWEWNPPNYRALKTFISARHFLECLSFFTLTIFFSPSTANKQLQQHGKTFNWRTRSKRRFFVFESLRAAVTRNIHSETHAWLLLAFRDVRPLKTKNLWVAISMDALVWSKRCCNLFLKWTV